MSSVLFLLLGQVWLIFLGGLLFLLFSLSERKQRKSSSERKRKGRVGNGRKRSLSEGGTVREEGRAGPNQV